MEVTGAEPGWVPIGMMVKVNPPVVELDVDRGVDLVGLTIGMTVKVTWPVEEQRWEYGRVSVSVSVTVPGAGIETGTDAVGGGFTGSVVDSLQGSISVSVSVT